MKFARIFPAALLLLIALPGLAQDQGYWRASSSTARSITGDIVVGPNRLSLGYSSFPLAQIHSLTSAQAASVFDVAAESAGGGNLYRINIPGEKRFHRHSALCGGSDTQWMATWQADRELHVAFFSGSAMPVFTMGAISNSSSLCGTFDYVPE